MATTHNFKLIGGRATITTTDGGIIGLAANTLVSLDQSGNIKIGGLTLPYTAIAVNDVDTSSASDALTKINTLLGTAINEAISSGGGGSTPVTPVTKTTGLLRTSTSGSVATGSTFASIANIGTANATVKTVTIEPGVEVTFPTAYGELNDAIAYDGTGTILLIATRR